MQCALNLMAWVRSAAGGGGGQAARRGGGRAVEVQGSGFASDSLRVINGIRREAAALQILLFSATFDEQAPPRLPLPACRHPIPCRLTRCAHAPARAGRANQEGGVQIRREGRPSARA